MGDDPNFPANLAIAPSTRAVLGPVALVDDDLPFEDDAAQDVERFGIAGRTWEAAYLARSYLALSTSASRPSSSPPLLIFDPPCPLLSDPPLSPNRPAPTPRRKRTILELGAGTGFLSLAVAPHLSPSTTRLVVTDLHNVCPLLNENLGAAQARWAARGVEAAEVLVRPLPWGDAPALEALGEGGLMPDLVLASDLVYFPVLHAPLLRTLLGLTEPRRASGAGDEDVDDERGQIGATSPKVVFSYKVRSLVKEQPFWEAFGRWFDFEPVQLGTRRPPSPAPSTADLPDPTAPSSSSSSSPASTLSWTRLGASHPSSTTPGTTDELYVFVCARRTETYGFDGQGVSDSELLEGRGERARGVEAGAARFEEMMLAGLEWD
ncbi:hypothetical protein JCM8208_003656 [Rhodotorula glutinis]